MSALLSIQEEDIQTWVQPPHWKLNGTADSEELQEEESSRDEVSLSVETENSENVSINKSVKYREGKKERESKGKEEETTESESEEIDEEGEGKATFLSNLLYNSGGGQVCAIVCVCLTEWNGFSSSNLLFHTFIFLYPIFSSNLTSSSLLSILCLNFFS